MRLNRLCVIPGRGCAGGVVGVYVTGLPAGRRVRNRGDRRKACERPGVEGKTPVAEIPAARWGDVPSSMGLEESRVNLAGPPAKPKYSLVTDSG